MSQIEIFSPVAETRTSQHPLAARPDVIAGKRIGLLNNQKANAGELLAGVAKQFADDRTRCDIHSFTKDATAAAPDVVMAHLKSCDAVVLAIAD